MEMREEWRFATRDSGALCVSWDYYDAEVVRRHLAWSWHNRWANFKEDDTKLTKLSLSGSISYTASKYGWGTGPIFFLTM